MPPSRRRWSRAAAAAPAAGGAWLTEAGEAVLAHYRKLETITQAQGADEIAGITKLLKDEAD